MSEKQRQTGKTCLNCKYEPVWSEWSRSPQYRSRVGICQWDGEIPPLPGVYILQKRSVIRYEDDSGVKVDCPAWKAKSV